MPAVIALGQLKFMQTFILENQVGKKIAHFC